MLKASRTEKNWRVSLKSKLSSVLHDGKPLEENDTGEARREQTKNT